MGKFLRDLDRSKTAVKAVMDWLAEQGYVCVETEKELQHKGDIEVLLSPKANQYIEVKYDMYAEKSGNLCFEMSNGKKATGVMTTEADTIYYVVPDGRDLDVYIFNPDTLKTYLEDGKNVTIKNGGDKKKFVLALVSINNVIADGLSVPQRI